MAIDLVLNRFRFRSRARPVRMEFGFVHRNANCWPTRERAYAYDRQLCSPKLLPDEPIVKCPCVRACRSNDALIERDQYGNNCPLQCRRWRPTEIRRENRYRRSISIVMDHTVPGLITRGRFDFRRRRHATFHPNASRRRLGRGCLYRVKSGGLLRDCRTFIILVSEARRRIPERRIRFEKTVRYFRSCRSRLLNFPISRVRYVRVRVAETCVAVTKTNAAK